MTELPVGEPLETTIEEPDGSLEALRANDDPGSVAARWPDCLTAWASLGESALQRGRPVDAYAYFRVGYHRGLDTLRAAGWRGNGYVRWRHPTNRGFLRCLDGLRAAASDIGEGDEAERCEQFLHQLDPDWDRRDEIG